MLQDNQRRQRVLEDELEEEKHAILGGGETARRCGWLGEPTLNADGPPLPGWGGEVDEDEVDLIDSYIMHDIEALLAASPRSPSSCASPPGPRFHFTCATSSAAVAPTQSPPLPPPPPPLPAAAGEASALSVIEGLDSMLERLRGGAPAPAPLLDDPPSPPPPSVCERDLGQLLASLDASLSSVTALEAAANAEAESARGRERAVLKGELKKHREACRR